MLIPSNKNKYKYNISYVSIAVLVFSDDQIRCGRRCALDVVSKFRTNERDCTIHTQTLCKNICLSKITQRNARINTHAHALTHCACAFWRECECDCYKCPLDACAGNARHYVTETGEALWPHICATEG